MKTVEEIIEEISNIKKQILNLQEIIFNFDDTKITDTNCIDLNQELNKALKHLSNAKETLKELS